MCTLRSRWGRGSAGFGAKTAMPGVAAPSDDDDDTSEYRLRHVEKRIIAPEDVRLTRFKKVTAPGVNVEGSVVREKADISTIFLHTEDFQACGGWIHRFKPRNELLYETAPGEVKNTASFFFTFQKNVVLDVEKEKVPQKLTSDFNLSQ